MKGKVFDSSQDLYQDQAHILFDYYRQAAEKIVTQEEAIEKKIEAWKNAEKNQAILIKNKQTQAIACLAGFVVGLAILLYSVPVGAIIAIVCLGGSISIFLKKRAFEKEIEQTQEHIAEQEENYQNIFRDYKVEKLGVVYIPIASQIPYENKSFLVDHTGSMQEEKFQLQLVNNQELLTEKINQLETLSTKAPLVESSEDTEEIDTDNYSRSIQKVTYHDYFSKMDRCLRIAARCLEDVTLSTVSLPVILPQSKYADYLKEYATNDASGAPILNIFNIHKYDKEIDDFNKLNAMRQSLSRESEQFEDVLKRLISNVGTAIQTIAMLKVASSHTLVEESNQLLFHILKASYNHYSPLLEQDEIEKMRHENFNFSDSVEHYTPFRLKESSRVRYDIISDSWVAEDGSKTTMPFGISQIQEEIVAPIVQNLLMESRVERLKIYNNIKDQKINYLNQWHQDTEDFYGRNRTSSDDLRNLMRSNLTQFMASQATLASMENMKKSIRNDEEIEKIDDGGAEMLAAFKLQSDQFENVQTDFEEYMNRLKDDINDRATAFGHVEYYDGSLRDRNAKDLVDACDNVASLDERRKPLVVINPLYAKVSEIPPEPNVESIMNEHLSLNLNAVAMSSLKELEEDKSALTNG